MIAITKTASLLLIVLCVSFCVVAPPRDSGGPDKKTTSKKSDKQRGRRSDGYFHVFAVGDTMREAKRRARKYIVEDGLGAYIEAHAVAVDAELKQSIITSKASGFVYDFHVVKVIQKRPVIKIHAKGKVSEKTIGQAIKFRYAEIGKPRLMVLFKETIAGRPSGFGRSVSEAKLIARFKEFNFIDRRQLARIIAREGGDITGAYNDSALHEKAVAAAAELEADFLVVGETDVKQGPRIGGTNMYSIQAQVGFKIVSVGNAQIIASASDTYSVPFINVRQGAVHAIERAVDAIYPGIIEQVGERWSPGQTIRVVFEEINIDDFVDLDFKAKLKKMKKIGRVLDRGRDANGNIVLEVEALMSGPELYRLMRRNRAGLGVDITGREVKGNLIRMIVRKK